MNDVSGLNNIALWLIRGYQYVIKPYLPLSCRFEPSCSTYAIEAFQSYGFLKGSYKALRRILRCHPGCQGGYDPVNKDKEIIRDKK